MWQIVTPLDHIEGAPAAAATSPLARARAVVGENGISHLAPVPPPPTLPLRMPLPVSALSNSPDLQRVDKGTPMKRRRRSK